MGLNGAFLTGDLFNLFVFFEVMLAASYGLQLHGSGWPRVRSGLHYIAVNLLASSLFLVGLAMLYGVMGTLSMADIAAKLPLVPATRSRAPARGRGDPRGGVPHQGGDLAAQLLARAGLHGGERAGRGALRADDQGGHLRAPAPVDAALLRGRRPVGALRRDRSSSTAGSRPSPSASLGLMASLRLGRIAGFSIIVSSGTLLAAIGMGVASVTSAALFYLLSATLAASALFLLVELVERIGHRRPRAAAPTWTWSRARTPTSTTTRSRSSAGCSRCRWRCSAWPSSPARCSSPGCRRCRASSRRSRC